MGMKGYPNIGEALDTRILEQRARLEFHYPKEDIIVFLPFYENPVITESKNANLVEYNPLGRAGSMFAYTGAKSRKIKLTMHYTLPHLMRFNMGVEKFRRLISADSKEVQKGLFESVGSVAPLIESSMAYEMDKYYSRLLLGNEGYSFGGPRVFDPEGHEISLLEPLGPTEREKAIDTLVFFTNVIRTSVDNAATNPFFGPPIIRVVYGSMYQSVPCICKSYNISYEDKEAGYDLQTLTPRRMKISLDLAEIRVGNFGKFSKGTVIERDNLAGWESVINNPLTTDPGKLE